MTKEQAATAIRLATAARPTHYDDDGSERQIEADHDFWGCLEFHGLDLEKSAYKLCRHDTATASVEAAVLSVAARNRTRIIDCGILWIADQLDGKNSAYISEA